MGDVPECPIALVPFEAEGPNCPYSLPCNHDISKDALQQLLRHSGAKECPICRQRLPSTNIASYRPNYGMITMLQMIQQREKASQQSGIPHTSHSQDQPYTEANSSDPNASQQQPRVSPRSNRSDPVARHPYLPQSISMPHPQEHAEHALHPQSASSRPHPTRRSDASGSHASPYSLYAHQALVRDSEYSTMPPTALPLASTAQPSSAPLYAGHACDTQRPTRSVSMSHAPASARSQYAVYVPDAQHSAVSGAPSQTPGVSNSATYAVYTPDSAPEARHSTAPARTSLPLYMPTAPRPQAQPQLPSVPPSTETQSASAQPISQDAYSLAPPQVPGSVASTVLYPQVQLLDSVRSMPHMPAQGAPLRARSMAEYQAISMPHYTGSHSTAPASAHPGYEGSSATESSDPSQPVGERASGSIQRSLSSREAHRSRQKPFVATAMRFIKALHPTKEEILGAAPGRQQFMSR